MVMPQTRPTQPTPSTKSTRSTFRKYRDVEPEGDIPPTRTTGLSPNFWYPLARSRDLKAGKTLAVSFAGEEIVLVRPAEGAPFALADRCAHRQVPLSMGVVQGEQLLCGYHCWAFDRSGSCVNIPYLNKERKLPNGVRSYPCREAYGFVFVFPGDPELADLVAMPSLPNFGDRRFKTRVLDRDIHCHYSFMHENLMDMNHQFLHRSLMGRIRAKLLDVREGEDWIEADYTFGRTEGKQSFGERLIIGTDDDTKYVDLMTIRTGYPYQSLRYWTDGNSDEAPALDLWNAYVPTDRAQQHNHTYGVILVQKPPVPGLIHLLWPAIVWFTEGIFGQDEEIVVAEQRAYDQQGTDLNNEVFPIIQGLKRLLARNGVPNAAGVPSSLP